MTENNKKSNLQYDSLVVQGVPARENEFGAIMPPIFLASTYRFEDLDHQGQYEYVRTQNPTREKAERLIARLEGAKYGFGFSSGMAALATVFEHFKPGDRVISSANIYGGTYRFLSDLFTKNQIDYSLIQDLNHLTDADFTENTKAVYIETPSNPTLRVTDIQKVVEIAHRHNALVICDNTFMTSYLQRPLDLGADVVAYSATKYFGGHADLCVGFVVCNDSVLGEEFYFYQNTLGSTISPFDSYTLIRGTKTLALRLDRQQENAKFVVDALQKNPAIAKVYTPGSSSAEELAIHQKQATGNGAVISFAVTPDVDLKQFFNEIQMIDLAVSLGGVESIMCRPSTSTHEPYPKEEREQLVIDDQLVRFAIGIENKEDIIKDVEQALKKARH